VTDYKLLEYAAKAAGIDGEHSVNTSGSWVFKTPKTPNWNPLIDDGDALRLAVKLGILIDTSGGSVNVQYIVQNSSWPINEYEFDNIYSATRRAIVRAAAEIGKAMP
jgi:hypothetical protein